MHRRIEPSNGKTRIMTQFSIRLVNEPKPESVEADTFSIDERGNLLFFTGDNKSPIPVFAAGQWQFVKEI